MPKYEFTEACCFKGHTIHRIRALRNFGNVKAGDLGGWLESEWNLSQEGDCWVADEAKVMDQAQVQHHAIVRHHAIIGAQASIYDYAIVEEYAEVKGSAAIFGYATVSQDAQVRGWARIGDHAYVDGGSLIHNGTVGGYAKIGDCAILDGWVTISDHAHIYEDASIREYAKVSGHAVIGNDVVAYGAMSITDNAYLFDRNDLLYLPAVSSVRSRITFYRCKDDSIGMTCADFHGSFGEFRMKIADMHQDKRDVQEYCLAFELAKAHIRCEPLLEKG